MTSRTDRLALPVALLMQAAVLLPHITLLPVWGDEQATLTAMASPLPQVLQTLRTDFNPPLFFLFLRLWDLVLPLSLTPIAKARLASVGFALLATVAIDRLWLRGVSPRVRAWFLLLWVTSPALLLYARMGRSYTAQVFVAALAIRAGLDWYQQPSPRTRLRYAALQALLFYLHYLPGLALFGSLWLAAAGRLVRGDRSRIVGMTWTSALVAVFYGPWIVPLVWSMAAGLSADMSQVLPNVLFDHGLRLAYTVWAWTFGEIVPPAVLILALVLAPVLAWALVRGWPYRPALARHRPRHAANRLCGRGATRGAGADAGAPALPPAVLPARPRVCLRSTPASRRGGRVRPRSRLAAGPGQLSSARELPEQILPAAAGRDRARISASGASAMTLLIVDVSDIDATPLIAALAPSQRIIIARDESAMAEIDSAVTRGSIQRAWLVRNTHDVSPDGWSQRLRDHLVGTLHLQTRRGYVPHDALDRRAMRFVGWPVQPDVVLEVLAFTPGPS